MVERQQGRAHHRVLHFVNRNPGIRVADLLDILRITKQSLGRVLKALIDQDYIEQRAGPRDRRQRLLLVTRKGHVLAMKLASLQSARINRALDVGGRPRVDGSIGDVIPRRRAVRALHPRDAARTAPRFRRPRYR